MSLVESTKPSRKRKPVVEAPAAPESEGGDFIWEVSNIARLIGRSRAQTFHLIYTGALDGCVKKVGGTWVGSRRKLIALLGGE